MKKYVTYLLLIALCVFPIFTQAMSTYDNAVNTANRYIEQYKSYDYDRYINTENTKQIYSGGKLVNSSFYRGGFLSLEEYEISRVRGHSYLSTGIEYWLSNTDANQAYVLSNILTKRNKNESSGVRVSVLPKPSAYVKGTGNFNNPWEFLKSYYIYVGSNDTTMGTVSPNEKQYVLEDRKGIVTYSPKLGYKYVNNTCAELVGSITQNVSAGRLEIGGLRQDTSCKIIFGPKTFILSLKEEGITTNPVPNTIYLKYNTGFYSDASTTTTINNITIPEKIGYIFKGYKLGETLLINETGSIDTSKKKAVVNNDDNQQLNSLWEAIKYSVDFNKNASDATGSMESQIFTYDQTTNNNLRINNFTRTGYTFLGWSRNADATTAEYQDGAAVLNLTAINNDNVTLYAVWQANNYSIRFESCDGTIASNKTIAKKYDEYFDVTAVYTKKGYSIIGYSKTSCSGNNDYPISSQIKNLANAEGSSVTLYTLWKSNDYKIVYEPNGGTGAIDATQCTYDSNCSVTNSKFNREGYEFVGWNTSSSATTANYNPGQIVKNLKDDSTNFTLYAIWKQCAAGKYSNTNVCVNCPDGKWSSAGAASCYLSCDAGYKCTGGSKTVCGAGTYSTGGASNCASCAAGKYANGTGNTTCTSCAAGTYASGTGNTTCTPCVAGTYASGTGNTTCTSCAAGKYASGTGNSTCTSCPAGTYASGTGNSSCTSCAAGTYSNSGASSCTTCSAGSYNTTTGNSTCTTCPNNYYCTGGTNKTSCPQGYSSYLGSKTSSDCKACPDGTYYNGSSCVTCTAGYKCTGGNRTICPAGTFSSSGSSSCTSCAAGKYASGTGNTSCTSCAAGKYASGTGNSSCTSCAAGKYASGTGNTSCTPCSGGTYSTGTGNTSCITCGANTYAYGTGNTSCTPCPSDKISSPGATQCTSCAAGQYLLNGSCVTCPAGYYCKNGTKTACSAGTYASGTGNTSCTTCSGGSYNTGTGNTSCSTCPSNYYCTGGTNKTACPNGGTSSSGSSSSSQCASICSKSDSSLFGTSKDSMSGNSTGSGINVPDSWGNWCHTFGTTCLAPKAYTRVCASDLCGSFKGSTATAINSAAGCDFAPYWCTECCSNGTNNGDGTCKRTCQAGTYDNGSTCSTCPAGTYSSAGATSCTSCLTGYYSTAGSSSCTICPAGSYCVNGYKYSCSAGKFTAGTGRSSCSACPDGTYSDAGASSCYSCPSGYKCLAGVKTICPAGTKSTSNRAECTTCPAGTYNTTTGNSTCTTCPAGYYCTGGTNKTACPTGYTSASGSTSSSACKDNTKPTVTCEETNATTSGVTVKCTCSDSASGCESATTTNTYSSAGTYTVSMSDRAGNIGTKIITIASQPQYRYRTCTSFQKCENLACGYKNCPTAGCGVSSYNYSNFGAYQASKYGSYTSQCKSRTGKNPECPVSNYTITWGGNKTSKYGSYQLDCVTIIYCSAYKADGAKCGYTYGSWGSWSSYSTTSCTGSNTKECDSRTETRSRTCSTYKTNGSICGYTAWSLTWSSWSDSSCAATTTKQCDSRQTDDTSRCKTYKANGNTCGWTYSNYSYYSTTIGHYNCGSKITSGTYKNKYRCASTRTAKRCASAGCETYYQKTQTRYKTRSAKACAEAGCSVWGSWSDYSATSCTSTAGKKECGSRTTYRYRIRTQTANTCSQAGCATQKTEYDCPTAKTPNYSSCTGYSCPSTRTVNSYNTCENSECGIESCNNINCSCTLLGWSSYSDWLNGSVCPSSTSTTLKQCQQRTIYYLSSQR